MRCKAVSVWGGIIAVCLNFDAFAGMKENPSEVISKRNPFALQTPPAPTPTIAVTSLIPPPPEIKLTGLFMLDGVPGAILEVVDSLTKKTDRPPLFREGDVYRDEIQIVGIDPANGVVRIRRGGAETTLDFERNGIKPDTTRTTSPTLAAPRVAGSLPGQPPQENSLQRRMTREEVAAHIERQRALYQQQNDSMANILPPTRPGLLPDASLPNPR